MHTHTLSIINTGVAAAAAASTLSAATLLSLSIDGPIPPRAMARAQQIDKSRAPLRAAKIGIKSITLSPATITMMMATTIVDGLLERQEVTKADFERIGLSPEQIDTYKTRAYQKALVLDKRIMHLVAPS